MKMKKTRLALYIVLIVLLLSSAVATAYAKYASTPLTDQFNVYVTAGTIADFGITGGETGLIVTPGTYLKLTQNPTVSLAKTSEDCFVFLKVTKSNNVAGIMTVTPDSTVWTALDGEDGVYYRSSTATDNMDALAKREYKVFSDATLTQSVWVSPEATKAQIEAITSDDKITFTAYAVQVTPGIEDPATAWSRLGA